MLFREIVNLITITNGKNALGDPIKVPTKGPDIFADKQSVKRSEFYQAAATGLRPELIFVIRTIEYNQEPMLEFSAKQYNVIRTFEKDSEFIELVCSGAVNNASA